MRLGSSKVVTVAGTSRRSCAPLIDAFTGAAVLSGKTAALIRPQQQQYCRLFLKFAAFKVVPRHYPLTETHSPRRNLYIPIYLLIAFLHGPLRIAFSFFARHVLPLIIQLFALAQPQLHFYA